jgi:hypothetical protein
VDLVERGYSGEVINFRTSLDFRPDIKGPLLCGCREFNYLACAVTLRRIRGSVPGSAKRNAAQRSWLTSAVAPERVKIRKLQGPSL